MKILDSYIGQVVTVSVIAVAAVLMTLFALIGLANEAGSVGRADYTFMAVLVYTLLRVPFQLYQIFPLSVLLGTMLGLGMMATHAELIVIRASGVSIARIVISVIKSMAVLIVIVIFIGEVIAPPAHQYAIHSRLKALESKISLNTDYGLWARDGDTYIHVRHVENDGRLMDVSLYRFNEKLEMESVLLAETGIYDGNQWILDKVKKSTISAVGTSIKEISTIKWHSLLAPDLVDVVSVNPETLSSFKLFGYIDYLETNGLESSQYKLVLWNRLLMPFTIIAMILLAVPFVFGSLRQGGIGQKIVVGFLAGIIFYILNRLAGQIGLVYDLPAVLAAGIPTLLVLIGSAWLFRRIR
ncbi:MAG: LPS export ABC transporter permease LptG [Gammaproteobacteria bacterium]|nr:LPS export ABC transporter permease LptG [Gammaproteobacteria bacterium]